MSAKKNVLSSIIVSLILGVIFGVLLILLAGILDVAFLIRWSLIIVGIITVIGNVPSLVNGIMNVKKTSGIIDLVFAIVGIVLGVMMIFMHDTLMTVILATYFIAFPVIRIILSGKEGWKDQIKREWLKILIGALLIAFLPAILATADFVVKTIILVCGWVVIGLSVLFFVISLVSYIKACKNQKENAPIEVTAVDSNTKE